MRCRLGVDLVTLCFRVSGENSMFTENKLRREFLKGAGTGLAGTALAARAGQGTAMAAVAETKPGTFNVRAFGAAGDGKSLDTEAVNKAIGAAAAAGGGTVHF